MPCQTVTIAGPTEEQQPGQRPEEGEGLSLASIGAGAAILGGGAFLLTMEGEEDTGL